MKIYLKLIWEGLLFALRELVVNKTRTFLSLLGISIGIFAIISVFTVFDSMELQLRSSLNNLGNNVLFVEKWPWVTDGNFPWWKYMNRPQATLHDLKVIEKHSKMATAASFMVSKSKTLKRNNNVMSDMPVRGISFSYAQIMPLNIEQGRYFSRMEVEQGRQVAVIGAEVADNLFPEGHAVGKTFKIGGSRTTVIGVIKKEGEGAMLSFTSDEDIYIPVRFMRTFVDLRHSSNSILVQAKAGVSNEELSGELKGLLRAAHRLSPKTDDDFSINETSIISNAFDQIFTILATVGWVIGSFSLLVGGFGVANIMFISVTERTRIIGIQKSLGAKSYFILWQFMIESICLSLLGGLLGLLLVLLLVVAARGLIDFPFVLTFGNIVLGVGVSSFIGMLSGLLPSLRAARLDPVEAMRSNA